MSLASQPVKVEGFFYINNNISHVTHIFLFYKIPFLAMNSIKNLYSMSVFKASIRKILQLSSLILQVRLKNKIFKSNSKILEESHILMAEIAMYPFTAFMSDIGGSAGLLLGLNVLGKIFSHLIGLIFSFYIYLLFLKYSSI